MTIVVTALMSRSTSAALTRKPPLPHMPMGADAFAVDEGPGAEVVDGHVQVLDDQVRGEMWRGAHPESVLVAAHAHQFRVPAGGSVVVTHGVRQADSQAILGSGDFGICASVVRGPAAERGRHEFLKQLFDHGRPQADGIITHRE
ncbi:hypothetical protein E4N62_43575 [Streptomyces sp. MNU76]|uniref:hypothetical protein n=1 Tax=Streptomyces sp. MNU76 TaxID=2560026 RepID=UPI001E4166F8|nr:hypothetical protein [Streptomyces sp. MNU76]MCC9711503.1 hypothetical protein [Streptomyces sp. MNU76]